LRRFLAILAITVLAAGLAGCGSGTTSAPSAAPTIADAWVRPPAGADRPAAGYMKITNPGGVADALIGVTTDAAMTCQIHETSMDSSGMAGMHEIDRLEIAAGATIELAPGGYHLMLMEPKGMAVGDTIELKLQFEHAGTVVVQAEVREG
jgi:copper(I)-binding protein